MYKCINGWTKEKMKAAIMERMLDHRSVTQPGIGGRRRCVYRAPDGNRCAVGVFIPDDEYTPELDVYTALSVVIVLHPTSMPLEYDGLSAMQTQHDHTDQIDPRPGLCAWIDATVEDA